MLTERRKCFSAGSNDCELLLFLFLSGAIVTILHMDYPSRWFAAVPGGPRGCMAALLGFASVLISSLNAIYLLPAATILFGSAAVLEAECILQTGLTGSLQRLCLLLLTVPLYFVLCVCGIHAALGMRLILDGKSARRTACFVSLTMLLIGGLASAALFRLALIP